MIAVITGATGFIGKPLVAALRARGDEVRVLARNPDAAARSLDVKAFAWDDTKPVPAEAMRGAGAVVHLAGEGIADKRWSDARKKRLVDSRIDGTRRIVEAIAAASPKPAVLVSGSAIGVYGDVPEGDLTETSAAGTDFLAKLCVEWEQAAIPVTQNGVRLVLLRTGLVMHKSGGPLGKMLLPFKLGGGGPIGSGRQWMSWIHLDDEIGIILHALDRADVSGPLNATAPAPARSAEFARTLGKVLRRPAFLPTPAFALKLLLGEMASVALLTGQRALPAKAAGTGYRFRHPELEAALRAAV